MCASSKVEYLLNVIWCGESRASKIEGIFVLKTLTITHTSERKLELNPTNSGLCTFNKWCGMKL